MPASALTQVTLTLQVYPSITVLPRVLQILSRRGYRLLDLSTRTEAPETARMICRVEGPAHWHPRIGALIDKLIDVHSVTLEEVSHE